ncbi:two-component sensor histidine kinase, partial [Streptomyces sp. A73]|nr:two-component sensor histidine kinase [Streptomyces sp. A73]
MRRRLILSILAVVLVVVAVFGISLVIVESRTIENSTKENVRAEAVRLVSTVESRLVAGERVTKESIGVTTSKDRYVRYIRIELPDRRPIEVGERPSGDVVEAKETGAHGEHVTVQASRSAVRAEVGRTLLIILAVALLAVVAAAVLAVRQAHRVAAPLTDLAETAERLGSGDPRPRHRRYGVPELD